MRRNEVGPGDRINGTCPACAVRSIEVLPFRYAFRGSYLYGVRCTGCLLVRVEPQPTDEEIAALYGEEYFTECSETCGAHGPAAYMEMADASGTDRDRGAARLDSVLSRELGGRGRLLEVGCGPGFFLAAMEKLGWTVQGIEISAFAAKHASEALGLDVACGTIEGSHVPSESLDAVFMGDVLEHLARPITDLRQVRDWLRPNGVVVIAVPSTLNLLSAKLGLIAFQARRRFKTLKIPPYHLFEYTPGSLRTVLARAGFQPLYIRQSAVPIGRMGLRGSKIENMGKVSLQVMAHLTSRLLNQGGDRLLAVGRRHPEAG